MANNATLRALGPLHKALDDARQTCETELKAYRTLAADPRGAKKALAAALKKARKAQADLKKAERAWQKGYQAYRDLPEEVDAWKVGGRVADAYAAEEK